MKKLFKALAAIAFVALFMGCELTLIGIDDTTEITVYNNTGSTIYYLKLYNDTTEVLGDDLLGTSVMYDGGYVVIDTTDTSLVGYYLIGYNSLNSQTTYKLITSDTGTYYLTNNS